jgi:hypothetical protein
MLTGRSGWRDVETVTKKTVALPHAGEVNMAAGVFSRNAQRPCEGLPGAASQRSGWVAVASAVANGRFGAGHDGEGGGGGRVVAKRTTTLRGPARGCVPAVGNGSRWHRRGRMGGSGLAMVRVEVAAGVFSRNAQRPCESLSGAASRRTGGVAVASAGADGRLGAGHGGAGGGGGGSVFAKRATTLGSGARGSVRCDSLALSWSRPRPG